MSTKIKFPIGTLYWVSITGDGKDQSEAGDGSKMKKTATLHLKTDSAECKALKADIEKIWELYKAENPKIKAATKPKSLGYKVVKDKETDEETDMTAFSLSTNSFYKDGKPAHVPLYNAKGAVHEMGEDEVGNGSVGTVYGETGPYEYKGSFGISLYLKAVQIIPSKLKLRSSDGVEAADISAYGDDRDSEGPAPIEQTPESTPNI